MGAIDEEKPVAQYKILLVLGAQPLLDYPATILGRPLFALDSVIHQHQAFSAICHTAYQLVIVEPVLADGGVLGLIVNIASNLQSGNRPALLRIGNRQELQEAWPLLPVSFDVADGTEVFNLKIMTLLGLKHRRAQRHMIRLNFSGGGSNMLIGTSSVISTEGMLFSSHKRLTPGLHLDFELLGIPEMRGVAIPGIVIRQEASRSSINVYAIKFNNPSPENKMRLERAMLDQSGGILASPDWSL